MDEIMKEIETIETWLDKHYGHKEYERGFQKLRELMHKHSLKQIELFCEPNG